ncbi:MAG: 2,3,4,5-tetrahydropyridine-2,6-dicarboxylate N-succinyltransferase [Alphaproteobacteria bacterium]|nr:2,3,4,5-tetrahydropyridine-2,6-dicarboxylate N-succinyltransferase [Alphaproteobacteria bacterium]
MTELQQIIDKAWENRESITTSTKGEIRESIEQTLSLLDCGKLRVAEKSGSSWTVNQWAKKAVLLWFRLNDMALIGGGQKDGGKESFWFDKIPSKFSGWTEQDFKSKGFRAVPNCTVRYSAFIAPNVVIMPSFVNLGAYIDSGTMIDSWVTLGSCAQIGKNVHISSNVCIGGVLEPLQADPVIIEDNCFIGTGSQVVEGVIIEKGSVISMGTSIGASTKIIDRNTGEVFIGRVPPYSVVVSGNIAGKPLPNGSPSPSTYCAVIVKRVDKQTRSKVSINDLLRE